MNKKIKLFLLVSLFLFSGRWSQAAIDDRLAGRILLQVQSKGEAWYVNPLDGNRYFLGRPADALNLMKVFGLGVRGTDFIVWKDKAPSRLAGRIVINIDNLGNAYYIHPTTLKLYSLGRPQDAFNVIRSLGLGISNADLAKINIGVNSAPAGSSNIKTQITAGDFNWQYKNKSYSLKLNLNNETYLKYKNSQHYFESQGKAPANWKDIYYAMFLTIKPEDKFVADLAAQLKAQADANGLSGDELVELTMGFVQSIPYDYNKANDKNSLVNYPYETLYKKSGICSDKAILAGVLLKEFGYGTALLVYPDINHATVGIQCPDKYAVSGTNYCYAETTDFFPIGFIPQNFKDNGIAVKQTEAADSGQFAKTFSTSVLGKLEIYQTKTGKSYQGMAGLYQKIEKLKGLEELFKTGKTEINALKATVDSRLEKVNALAGRMEVFEAAKNYASYNSLLPEYNEAVRQYNDAVGNYRIKIDNYNNAVAIYDGVIKDLYVASK